MQIIKLDVIESTNDYLKELAKQNILEDFTTVTASNQTRGKGQMGAHWNTQPGENLTMSVFVSLDNYNPQILYDLNVVVALSVVQTLKSFSISDIAVKWPNDVLVETKKIAGILIENSIKMDGNIQSIIGIGLNINQTNFLNLPKATSLRVITKNSCEIDEIMYLLLEFLKKNIKMLFISTENLWKEYHELLFKKDKPSVFEDKFGKRFMGIINGVNRVGQLEVLLENQMIQLFNVKEIQMLY